MRFSRYKQVDEEDVDALAEEQQSLALRIRAIEQELDVLARSPIVQTNIVVNTQRNNDQPPK